MSKRKKQAASAVSMLVYLRADGVCEYCLRPFPLKDKVHTNKPKGSREHQWNIDHLTPRYYGGDDGGQYFANLVMSCEECNSEKGRSLIGQWIPPIGLFTFWERRGESMQWFLDSFTDY